MSAQGDFEGAVADAIHDWMYGDRGTNQTRRETADLARVVAEVVPPVVFARFAIERGALVSMKWCMDEMCNGEHTKLYRLVDDR